MDVLSTSQGHYFGKRAQVLVAFEGPYIEIFWCPLEVLRKVQLSNAREWEAEARSGQQALCIIHWCLPLGIRWPRYNQGSSREQWFSIFSAHLNHLEGRLEPKISGLHIQSFWFSGAWTFAFLTTVPGISDASQPGTTVCEPLPYSIISEFKPVLEAGWISIP